MKMIEVLWECQHIKDKHPNNSTGHKLFWSFQKTAIRLKYFIINQIELSWSGQLVQYDLQKLF